MSEQTNYTIRFDSCGRNDVAVVGGKNASLGEMVTTLSNYGVSVPGGFATTVDAYIDYLKHNALTDKISKAIVEYNDGSVSLANTGKLIRQLILDGEWPDEIVSAISTEYRLMGEDAACENLDVAVRSSATAEDLPNASFAGQQETFLNITGTDSLLDACKHCFASLFTDRAISYRQAKGFDHLKLALSVGVQRMIRSDKGASGVMFSIDTETGFDKVVVIDAAWGLGETVVQGVVNPDEYIVFKPLLNKSDKTPIIEKRLGDKSCKMIYSDGAQSTKTVDTTSQEQSSFVLNDNEIIQLARWAQIIEEHYGCPMDMEWAKDGINGRLAIVQARPETVQSQKITTEFTSSKILSSGKLLAEGLSIGESVVSGQVCRIDDPIDRDQFIDGSILVTSNTDPDWVPIMKRAAGVITDHGGRTSHAAIVSRELGVPAIVGAVDATSSLNSEQVITLSCASGDVGEVFEGVAEVETSIIRIGDLPITKTKVYANMANPGAAFRWWRLPVDGIGLARMEFVISHSIKVHPMALATFNTLENNKLKQEIKPIIAGFDSAKAFFIGELSRGLGRIASTVYPKPVVVRLSDFKSNEYANLIGGSEFEKTESNPMLGFRGASRYYAPEFAEAFSLECQALKQLREGMGFDNIIIMVPFCRTVQEADKVLALLAKEGLARGENGLQIYMMCEIPSNVVLADQFASRFDGFSIGSNDLTQLTLGVDRDSEQLSDLFNEEDEAVEWMIKHVIDGAKPSATKVGLCGQAPSDKPEFAQFLVEAGIDSISVTPDSFIKVKQHVSKAEQKIKSYKFA